MTDTNNMQNNSDDTLNICDDACSIPDGDYPAESTDGELIMQLAERAVAAAEEGPSESLAKVERDIRSALGQMDENSPEAAQLHAELAMFQYEIKQR